MCEWSSTEIHYDIIKSLSLWFMYRDSECKTERELGEFAEYLWVDISFFIEEKPEYFPRVLGYLDFFSIGEFCYDDIVFYEAALYSDNLTNCPVYPSPGRIIIEHHYLSADL